MKKRLRLLRGRNTIWVSFSVKLFADEEAIETLTRCAGTVVAVAVKLFADEEAIETLRHLRILYSQYTL